ncbi:MAG: hypothetical protein J2P21_25290 [Chloracidobacterium sp.]|nr:hypothetical protein [Chloracidobacterium sp.]
MNAKTIINAPVAKTNAPIIKITESAPRARNATSNYPNAIERMAIFVIIHSPLISWRRRRAVEISSMQVTIAQNTIR